MLNIRRATRNDIPAIARVHVDTWRTTYRGIVSDEFLAGLSYEQSEETWHWVFDYSDTADGNFTFVAEDESGSVAGFANSGPERSGSTDYKCELNALYVLKSAQGAGLGRALVRTIVATLLASNLNSMKVWVLASNPACKFYERLGGQWIGDKEVEIGGRLVKEIAYGWRSISSINK